MANQKLLEAVADIAYQAGQQQYYSGDSRRDMSYFIYWAEQFETIHKKTDWDTLDYMEEIEKYTNEKLNEMRLLIE